MTRTDFGTVPMSLKDCEIQGAFVMAMTVPGRGTIQYSVRAPIKGLSQHKVIASCSRPEQAEMIVNALRFWSTTQGETDVHQ